MVDPTPVQIDLQKVVERLAAQLGQQSAELAATQVALEAQAAVIADLTSRVPPPAEEATE